MQGASTLRIKREEKPLSWNVWAPTWAELCEVIMSNDGLQPSTAHGPSNEQEHVSGREAEVINKGDFPYLVCHFLRMFPHDSFVS